MEIKDVKPNQGNIDLVAEVKSKENPRSFEKFGKKGKVCNATLKDKSGEITLTLWNDDVDSVNAGDKIHLKNGWCSEYKGSRQLSTGKFGKIEVVTAAVAGVATAVKTAAAKTPPASSKTVFTNDPGMLKKQSGDEYDDEDSGDEDTDGDIDEEFID